MTFERTHYINGKWLTGSGLPLQANNPATEEIIWEGHAADKKMIDQAVSSATAAFPVWHHLTFNERVVYLNRFQDVLLQNKSTMAEKISQSTGKPLWESLTEVDAMANKIPISIEAYRDRCPNKEKQQSQAQAIVTHRAHGALGVLGPFNFPGHLPNGHIIPALLAGNTVIFKPSELTPLVAEFTLKCWEKCGLPNGVINMIQGGKETGQYLSGHENLSGVLFTGSWPIGKYLAELLAKTPYKMLALEMGGNNPLIIGTITDFQTAAYLTIQSAFLTSGQRCTCARRLIIPYGSMGDNFIHELIKMIKEIQIGAYNDDVEPFMGPVISKHVAKNLLDSQKILLEAGAISLLPLTLLDRGKAFLRPALIDTTPLSQKTDVEYFGPFLQVIRVDSFTEAIKEANNTKYGLVAGLLSDDINEYQIFQKEIRAGIVNWNTPTTGASSASPFGGIGQSGNNRPGAFYAADYCAYPISSLISDRLLMPSKTVPGIMINQG